VLCCEKFGDIRDLGKDAPDTRRSVVTFNAQVQVDDETPA
jgi:hypothetical protein